MDAPPQKSTARELVEKAVEGGVGMVPVVGSPAAVAFGYWVGRAHDRRMDEWLAGVAEAITELQDTSEDWPTFEDLAEDDVFSDAVVNATRAAQATHQAEKLEALRNGVLNSIGPFAPSIEEQTRFFRLVDQFSVAHLRLLAFFADPGGFFDRAGVDRPKLLMGGRASLLGALPEFASQPRDWTSLLTADLQAAALTDHGGLNTVQSGDSLWLPATSELGQRFLAFVRPPATHQVG
ncbi:hypothetical protein [Geodermatophilus sp. SYSU D01105]